MNALPTSLIGAIAFVALAGCSAPKFTMESNTQGLQINVSKPVQQQLSIQSIQVEQNSVWTSSAFQVKYAKRDEVVLGTKGESALRIAGPAAKDATGAQVTFRLAPGKPSTGRLEGEQSGAGAYGPLDGETGGSIASQ